MTPQDTGAPATRVPVIRQPPPDPRRAPASHASHAPRLPDRMDSMHASAATSEANPSQSPVLLASVVDGLTHSCNSIMYAVSNLSSQSASVRWEDARSRRTTAPKGRGVCAVPSCANDLDPNLVAVAGVHLDLYRRQASACRGRPGSAARRTRPQATRRVQAAHVDLLDLRLEHPPGRVKVVDAPLMTSHSESTPGGDL